MENQHIAELYANERIEAIPTQVQEPNEAANDVEWRLDNQIKIVKDDLKRDIKDVKEDLRGHQESQAKHKRNQERP